MKKILIISLILCILLVFASCSIPVKPLEIGGGETDVQEEPSNVPKLPTYDLAIEELPELPGCCGFEETDPSANPGESDEEYEIILEPDPSCGDSSAACYPADFTELTEVSGTVKEVKDGLVLLSLADNGGDFMLRFSENSTFAQGVDTEFKPGNTVKCTVKPEPTFAPPAQGEVYEVFFNQ